MEIGDKGVLLGVRGKGMPGAADVQGGDPLPPARGHPRALHRRPDRPAGARPTAPGHYTEDEAPAMLRQAVRRVAPGDVERIAQAAQEAVPGDIDDDMAIVAVRTSPVDLASWDGAFPAEPIKVSEARRLAQDDVPVLGHGKRAGRADLPAGVRGGHQRRAAHARAARRPAGSSAESLEVAGRPPHRRAAAVADRCRRPVVCRRRRRVPPRRKNFTLRLRRGRRGGLGRGVRPDMRLPRIRSGGGERRGRPRPVPGRSAGHPVGVQADPGRQGGLVRDADRRRAS